MKIKRKFLKTSPFEKNMPISTMEDVYGKKYHYRRWRKRFLTYLLILALILIATIIVSCTVGPDYTRPVFFEDKTLEKVLNLKPTEDNSGLVPFDFQDDVLTRLLREGRQNSPSIRIALAKVRQSRAYVKISESDLMPTADINAAYHYLNAGNNMGLYDDENYYQSAIDMSWEIDIFGSNRRRLESAGANLSGMIENLKNIYITLDANIATQYIQLRTAEQLLTNAEHNLKIQTQIYETVSDQYEAGLAGEIALNQAKYLVETTRMSLPQLQFSRTQAQNALALLVGKLPTQLNDDLSRQKTNLIQQPFSYDLKRLYNLPVSVIRNRPDVRVAEERLIAQNALVGAAIADMFPNVSISGLLGFGALKLPDLANSDSAQYGITPQISVPLFHFGALKNNVAVQKAIKDEYLISYENTLLTAASEINNALAALETEKSRNLSAKTAYDKTKEVSALNWQKYRQGLIEYADVLDAEQRRLSAQTDMVNSNAALYRNIISYYKAIGSQLITP